MIEKIATHISHYMCNLLNTTEQDRLTYKYGLEIIIGELSKYMLLLLLFYIFDDFNYGLSGFIILLSVRSFVGGYHANSYWGCFGTTLSILLLGKVGYLIPMYVLNMMGVYILTIIWRYAPVYSRNKRGIRDSAKLRMKLGAVLIIVGIMCLNTWYVGVYSAFAIISYVTVFLITPVGSKLFKMEAVKDEEIDEEIVCTK